MGLAKRAAHLLASKIALHGERLPIISTRALARYPDWADSSLPVSFLAFAPFVFTGRAAGRPGSARPRVHG